MCFFDRQIKSQDKSNSEVKFWTGLWYSKNLIILLPDLILRVFELMDL